MTALLGAMGVTDVPAQLQAMGLPIPAVALAAKLGGIILPFDVGLKGMMVPDGVKASLASSTGVTLDYTLIGGNVRYAVLRQGILLPDLSIGAGYNRLSGSVMMPLDIGSQSFTFNDGTQDHTLAVTTPNLALGWTTDSFDFTVQASKSILFIEPYLGVGLSVGKSAVKGGVKSEMTYDTVKVGDEQVKKIKEDLAEAGIAVPAELSAAGFLFGAENASPVVRVYGGVTLSFLVIKLDTGVTYVPQTGSLGGQSMIRIQF